MLRLGKKQTFLSWFQAYFNFKLINIITYYLHEYMLVQRFYPYILAACTLKYKKNG